MFSIRLEGAGVGDTALSQAQGLKMLTSGWQAALGLPFTGRAASRCPAGPRSLLTETLPFGTA